MEIAITVLLLIVGLVLIIKGGDFFVDAASWMAEASGIPKLIVGATVVSFATTLPELLVSIFAALDARAAEALSPGSGIGMVDMSIGNAIGSVTANLGLIMGIALVAIPMAIRRKDYMLKMILMLVAAAVTVCFSLFDNGVGMVASILLIIIFVIAMYDNIHEAVVAVKGGAKGQQLDEPVTKKAVITNVVKFLIGAVGTVAGAQLLVDNGSALDLKLRKDMQNELKKIQQAIGITFIFVTHDQEEALSMSDTVVVMDKGEIQQIGSPIDIYNEPKNAFVAAFIGESNILDGTMIEDYLVEVAGQRFKSLDSGFGKMAPVDVVIRPEDIDIVPTGSAAAHINGVVTSVTFKGVHYEIIVDVDGFKWMIQTTDSANVGDKIGLALTPDDIHVMAKSVYSGTMGDYSTFSDEMEEALQEEGSEHED